MPVNTLDEALEPFDVEGKLYDLALKEWGSTESQAFDFAHLHRAEFRLDGGQVTHLETGLPAAHPDCAALIARQYPHLVPPPFEVSLADRAFIENNFSARGQLVREMGPGPALELAKRYGHDTFYSRAVGKRPDNIPAPADSTPKLGVAGDHKNNPFSKEGWSITKQGSLLRAVGPEKCAQIARSVGSHIGATKPNSNH